MNTASFYEYCWLIWLGVLKQNVLKPAGTDFGCILGREKGILKLLIYSIRQTQTRKKQGLDWDKVFEKLKR